MRREFLRRYFVSRGLAGALVIWLTANNADAAHRFVARDGVDSASCGTTSSPCKTLKAAVASAAAGDKIICINPGGSPAFKILKGLEIDCASARQKINGNLADNSADDLDNAILIDTSSSADKVVRLRGLDIGGKGDDGVVASAQTGIYVKSASAVFLEDIVVSDTRQFGIRDVRTGGQTKLFVSDSVIRSIPGPGIVAASQAVGITVLDNVRLLNNTYGIATASGNNVFINRSVISGNAIAGVEADGGAQVEVSNSAITHNNIGVQAFGTIRLRENDIKFSNTAIQSATVSFGANRFSGNGSVGTVPTPAQGAPADVYN